MYTSREGYLICFSLLDLIWEKNDKHTFLNKDEENDFGVFLGSMDPFIFTDSMPADPAYWEDWLKCIGFKNSEEDYSKYELIDSIIKFIDFYIENFNFKLNLIKEELIRLKGKEALKILKKDDFIYSSKKATGIIMWELNSGK